MQLPPSPAKRRIALLTYISPLQKWGSAQRSRHLIDALLRHGAVDVVVLRFDRRGTEAPPNSVSDFHGARVIEIGVMVGGLPSRPRFDLASDHVTRTVEQHVDLNSYDLFVSRYVKPALKLRLPPQVPVVVDFDDAVYEPPWRALSTPKMWVGAFTRLLNDRLLVRMRLACRPHAHYFFCREAERRHFPALPGSVLPNLPAAPARPGPPSFDAPARPALMFVGLLDYMPNTDAVDWFLADIWPRVRAAVPDARFLIVGSGADELLARWRAHAGVETLGFVDSLADAYAQATASVVPMRGGAGTNIKALEPFHYGRPVIATRQVLEGYDSLFRDGQDMLAADDARTFAEHCIALLDSPARARELARSGYQRLSTHLTTEHFGRIVDSAVAPLLSGSAVNTAARISRS
ncbi:glycosyltransferase [Methylibium sp.]|jgi:glycosyltransferase involved in cell wall biosynthesis|uniref:glycosyltransferase n=1 Tax=Methylibium sp. TaxID=2067992 RepID=UPI003F6FD1E8